MDLKAAAYLSISWPFVHVSHYTAVLLAVSACCHCNKLCVCVLADAVCCYCFNRYIAVTAVHCRMLLRPNTTSGLRRLVALTLLATAVRCKAVYVDRMRSDVKNVNHAKTKRVRRERQKSHYLSSCSCCVGAAQQLALVSDCVNVSISNTAVANTVHKVDEHAQLALLHTDHTLLLELRRLKNIKRAEIQKRLEAIRAMSGGGTVAEEALEGDFDPDKWDQQLDCVRYRRLSCWSMHREVVCGVAVVWKAGLHVDCAVSSAHCATLVKGSCNACATDGACTCMQMNAAFGDGYYDAALQPKAAHMRIVLSAITP
eukprot:13087-Heterococcus_DN1.PRE.4